MCKCSSVAGALFTMFCCYFSWLAMFTVRIATGEFENVVFFCIKLSFLIILCISSQSCHQFKHSAVEAKQEIGSSAEKHVQKIKQNRYANRGGRTGAERERKRERGAAKLRQNTH